MLAMQYTIALPSDYNPSLIQERVEKRSALFDSLPGLLHKSYLFNAEDRLYAPFYVWENDSAAREFLLHDLFKGVIDSFTRPRVRNWNILEADYANREITPLHALREADSIAGDESLEEVVERERQRHAERLKHPELHYHTLALDSDRWELVRFSLWSDRKKAEKSESDCTQWYDVLHVNTA